MFGVPNAKYLAFGTPNGNALRITIWKSHNLLWLKAYNLAFGTPNGNALRITIWKSHNLLWLKAYNKPLVKNPLSVYLEYHILSNLVIV